MDIVFFFFLQWEFLKIYPLSNFQKYTVHYSFFNYSLHVVHYIPRTYLSYIYVYVCVCVYNMSYPDGITKLDYENPLRSSIMIGLEIKCFL